MKGWLLDTNVISEWRKPRPDRRVIQFLEGQRRLLLFTSVVCIAEIRIGIANVTNRGTAEDLRTWLDQALLPYFNDRVLQLQEAIVFEALCMANRLEKVRTSIPLADLLIAATATCHSLQVVTRNTRDFARTGIRVFNPWTGERFNGA